MANTPYSSHFGSLRRGKSERWRPAFLARTFFVFLNPGQMRIEFVKELIVLSTLRACFYPWGFRRLSQGIFAELRGQCESGGPAWSRSVPFE